MKIDERSLRERQPQIVGEEELQSCAVGIVLLEGESGDDVLFEVRSPHIKRQPGDICLPGGRVDEGESPQQAVIREISEELLVSEDQVHVIGPGDILVLGGLRIYTYICTLSGYLGTFSRDEVSEVFRVPVSFFLENKPDIYEVNWRPEMGSDFPFDRIYGGKGYTWRPRRSRTRFYSAGERTIWGITARIMDGFSDYFRGVIRGRNGVEENYEQDQGFTETGSPHPEGDG